MYEPEQGGESIEEEDFRYVSAEMFKFPAPFDNTNYILAQPTQWG